MANLCQTLSVCLSQKFEQTGDIETLHQAITAGEKAVNMTPPGHTSVVMRTLNLGSSMRTSFERTGIITYLDRSITLNSQALELVSPDDSIYGPCLNNLATSLLAGFHRTGAIEKLDDGIQAIRRAVSTIPVDHTALALCYNNLGLMSVERYNFTGSTDDLKFAIEMNEKMMQWVPKDSPALARHLCNLAGGLFTRYVKSGSKDDLARAVTLQEEAATLTGENHPDYLTCLLNNLGNYLSFHFTITGNIEDLNRAIRYLDKALKMTPDDHPFLAVGLNNNLGLALITAFEITEYIEYIDRAVATCEKAVEFTPPDDPKLTKVLRTLGNALYRRFQKKGDRRDFDRSIECQEQSGSIEGAAPSLGIDSLVTASRLLVAHAELLRAKPLLLKALDLLPSVSPRALKQADQQDNISQFSDIPSLAAAILLEEGESPYNVLQVLERGRGIIASLQLEFRTDISVLNELHPTLAQQFESIRDQLDQPERILYGQTESYSASISIEERRRISNRFDDVLRTIRELTGFERFLLGPSKEQLGILAEHGSIVVFNISEIRCDALLVQTDNVVALCLPFLELADLDTRANQFLKAVRLQGVKGYADRRLQIIKVLEWLWDVAVGPVLDELGFTQLPSANLTWPRVWWVGSRKLNILPIHAAGYHEASPPLSAVDRVISSYIPTVKSLAYAQERGTVVTNLDQQKVMLIGMPTTPEGKELPSVTPELNALQTLIPQNIERKILQNPARETVMHALRDHQIVHFACHGYFSVKDPSKSYLRMNDMRLTVFDLMSIAIRSPQFAFLSLCHSASVRNIKLLDEAINLSTAILLAGYPSVVGTLWEVNDAQGLDVAKEVYTWMLGEGKNFDHKRSAEGLHRSVRAFRERTRIIAGMSKSVPSDPLIWASYIHLGV
jgi:tetratricopeptide (TPR) repeat protein